MEVSRGSVYLYEFDNYDKLSMDIEVLMDVNSEYEFSLYSRLPTRRLIEKLDLSKLDHYWISNNESETSIKPSFDEMVKSMNQYERSVDRIYFLEGLEYLYGESNKDDLLAKIIRFADNTKMSNNVVIYCINSLAFDSEWIVKLRHLTEKMVVKTPDLTTTFHEDDVKTNNEIPGGDNETQFELAIDGGPRLTYLARLPRTGFNNDILVKRILQWRRMGLDVSRIEPALSYGHEEAFELYKSVEEDVRRATELERFIHKNQYSIGTTQIATDMFRIRQLTGLSDLEQKYYDSS